ncbi:hypothetical protein, partial [Salinispora arenicola]|uniref:hypothetical protein n=1 Tax=Salinispora arenicola TaxID=168697 RepID=UPI003F5CEC2C
RRSSGDMGWVVGVPGSGQGIGGSLPNQRGVFGQQSLPFTVSQPSSVSASRAAATGPSVTILHVEIERVVADG